MCCATRTLDKGCGSKRKRLGMPVVLCCCCFHWQQVAILAQAAPWDAVLCCWTGGHCGSVLLWPNAALSCVLFKQCAALCCALEACVCAQHAAMLTVGVAVTATVLLFILHVRMCVFTVVDLCCFIRHSLNPGRRV
jgi:hypothetical protein